MKTSDFFKSKFKSPAGKAVATLAIVAAGMSAPSLSQSACYTGSLGDCETNIEGGSKVCTSGNWWNDCGNSGKDEEMDSPSLQE